tara:strand:- start:10033 stop:10728 length:696 start_codon:yes stop_codon:yes gene_type:complete
MRVLIGYSACPHTRAAFERNGHEVWTCDLLPARGDTKNHLQTDIMNVVHDDWDMGIFHPMCTYVNVASAWALKDPDYEKYPDVGYHQRVKPETLTGKARRDARDEAIENFRRLLALPYPKAIENPAPSMLSKAIRPADQIIHPHQFGDDASKSTGLWLDRLPPLEPTKHVAPRIVEYKGRPVERWGNQTDSGQNNLSPGPERWLLRSATYPGIANAMGDQWGNPAQYQMAV